MSRPSPTRFTHAGRDPFAHHGILNPPVYHASTIASPTLADWLDRERSRFDRYTYGRIGTPTSDAFEQPLAELDGGAGAVAVSSGLAAVTTALLAVVRAGDRILISDSVYGPTRRFAVDGLARLGVETTFYDPHIGAGIDRLIDERTRAVYLESPGSLTFEIQDVPAIAAAAAARGAVTLIDNTWATPLFYRPIEHGVDYVIHAATKYICGHSDVMLGAVVARTPEQYLALKRMQVMLGQCAGPDDLYQGARGLRTLPVRLAQHQDSALAIARWLQGRPEVARVLHPALPEDPGHALWQRDFDGASGLFAVILHPVPMEAVAAMVDGLSLFPIGASWGGYESLIMPAFPERVRSATTWHAEGPMLRLHVGLEDVDELIADLDAGLERLRVAAAA